MVLLIKFVGMISCKENFMTAIEDYEFFLSRKYPQKTILKLVGDRYRLSGTERTMLYRGITIKEKAEMRFQKLIPETNLRGEVVLVDALNQLFTISAYLLGRPVFLCNDGFLRDAMELHGKSIGTHLPIRAFELVMAYFVKLECSGMVFYFDRQVNGCLQYYELLAKKLPDFIMQPEIILSHTVDKDLINQTEGFIATSDSVIIEKSPLKVFDLAKNTLEFHFWPEFFDLNKLISR